MELTHRGFERNLPSTYASIQQFIRPSLTWACLGLSSWLGGSWSSSLSKEAGGNGEVQGRARLREGAGAGAVEGRRRGDDSRSREQGRRRLRREKRRLEATEQGVGETGLDRDRKFSPDESLRYASRALLSFPLAILNQMVISEYKCNPQCYIPLL